MDVADLPLHVVRFTGQEGISEPFRFAVEVASAAEIDPETFVGQPALLTIQGLDVDRVVHGIVCEAEYIGATRYLQRYELIVEPWAHRLNHRHDCRIFQDKTTQQIVTEVLDEGRPAARLVPLLADRDLRAAELLRAIPRERPRVRQPAARRGRHLLLLRARAEPARG
nr:contractile injection system protein, VgrG/Pvc8 family [Nannocystis pusilla]